jgi:hypothetical protein
MKNTKVIVAALAVSSPLLACHKECKDEIDDLFENGYVYTFIFALQNQ